MATFRNGVTVSLVIMSMTYCAFAMPRGTEAPTPTTETRPPLDHMDDCEPKEENNVTSPLVIELDLNQLPISMNSTGSLDDLLNVYRTEARAGVLGVDSDVRSGFMNTYFDPNEAERGQRNIYGYDERLPVGDRRYYIPYCAIGYLASGCTATLIGPYHALTAAHCVYDTDTNTWKSLNEMTLYRRRDCNSYGDVMYATQAWSVTGYTQDHKDEYDYALIIYSSNDQSPCYLGFGYSSPWTEVGFDLTGYPQDKSNLDGCSYPSMWFSSCHYSKTAAAGLQLKYRCDMLPGNSGSALYGEKKEDSSVSRYVYGVNTHQSAATTGENSWNWGPRITQYRFYQIVGWMEGSGYYPLS